MKIFAIALTLLALQFCQGSNPTTPPAPTPPTPTPPTPSPVIPRITRFTTLKQGGGRVDWSPQNVIAFDQFGGGDSYYDVFVMSPDGSGERCLTCGRSELPGRHMGNPAWHPSGNYIVFQVQKAEAPGNPVSDLFASPGSGVNNDLWVMDRDGTRFWRLTNVPLGDGGVLHPHFSSNGNRIVWSERLSASGSRLGEWSLKVADFVVSNGVPQLQNINQYQPGDQHQFYESHGFTPDGGRIIFTGNLTTGEDPGTGDIYLFDLATRALTNLTQTPGQADEHAQIRPQGDWIIWTSTTGGGTANALAPRADYWMMRLDGSEKRQVTFFNTSDRPEFIPGGVAAADNSWSPDGTRLIAYILLDTLSGAARTMVLDVTISAATVTTTSSRTSGVVQRSVRSTSATTAPPAISAATPMPLPMAGPASASATALTTASPPPGSSRVDVAVHSVEGGQFADWDRTVNAMVRNRQLVLVATTPDPLIGGRVHERFAQVHNGVPVFGAEITRQRQRDEVVSMIGTLYRDVRAEVTPALAPEQARQKLADVAPSALAVPSDVRLVVASLQDGSFALAYRMRLVTAGGVDICLLDAQDGTLLARYPDAHIGAIAQGPRHAAAAATTATVAGASQHDAFDLRGDTRLAVDVLSAGAAPDWLRSFEWTSSSPQDPRAGILGEAASTLGQVGQRFGWQPPSTRPMRYILSPDRNLEARLPLFESAFHAGGGVLILPDAAADAATIAGPRSSPRTVAHAIGHAVLDSSSRLMLHGESGGLNEAFAQILEEAAAPSAAGTRTARSAGSAVGRVSGTLAGDPATRRATAAVLATYRELRATETQPQVVDSVFFRAFTLLLPSDATLEAARAATLHASRDLGQSAADRARLTSAWSRAGVN